MFSTLQNRNHLKNISKFHKYKYKYIPVNIEILSGLVSQYRAEVKTAFVHKKFN